MCCAADSPSFLPSSPVLRVCWWLFLQPCRWWSCRCRPHGAGLQDSVGGRLQALGWAPPAWGSQPSVLQQAALDAQLDPGSVLALTVSQPAGVGAWTAGAACALGCLCNACAS